MSPQTQAQVPTVRGKVADYRGATDETPATIEWVLPDGDYRIRLVVDGPVDTDAHDEASGYIAANAKKVSIVGTGGRFIEPVHGRPRRVQGRIAAVDAAAGTIIVRAGGGCPVVAKLTSPGQTPDQYQAGQFVGFTIEPGARFMPA